MASLTNANKALGRVHRERKQIGSRARLGELEHKKDYKKRADDFNRKRDTLKKLKQSALARNPDEYHFHMVNSSVGGDGVHRDHVDKDDPATEVQKKLGDLRSLGYVQHKLQCENRKIEKLQATLHLADTSIAGSNRHTIFVDDDKEERTFSPAKFFDTPAELLNRRFNRPRASQLQSDDRVLKSGGADKSSVDTADGERRKAYSELRKRLSRQKELKVVVAKMENRKLLAAAKGAELQPKRVKKGRSNRAAVFKWTYERKR